MEKISIIIPVYNVEKYINKCINSVLEQTYKNLEIILVDDGSTDNSGNICDEFKKKDKRIKVIHKINGGLSSARNAGIECATGNYIGFVDSDDYIETDMFETLCSLIKQYKADISIVSLYEVYNNKIISVRNSGKLELFTKIEAMKELLTDRKIKSYACNKLFKKELFQNVKYPISKNFEDIATTLLLFEQSNKVVLLQQPKYYYQRRDDSITGVKNYKTYKDKLDVSYEKFMYLDGKYKELDIYNAYNYAINILNIYCVISTYEILELNNDFEEPCNLLFKLVDKYGYELIKKMSDFDKATLYMLLIDKEKSKPVVKLLYNTYRAIKK